MQLGEGTVDTRRVTTHTKVDNDCRNLITRKNGLADQRLVVTAHDETLKEETVEIAHEALIREWPRLSQWLNENRDTLFWKQRIEILADEWERRLYQDDYLIARKFLPQVMRIQQTQDETLTLSELAQKFLKRSVKVNKSRTRTERIVIGALLFSPVGLMSFVFLFINLRELKIYRLKQDIYIAQNDPFMGESRVHALEELVKERVSLNFDLSGANLSGANLSGANFQCERTTGERRANLIETNFSKANLSGAKLSNCDLSYINLSGSNLEGADLSGTVLSFDQVHSAQNWEKAIYDERLCSALGLKQCRKKK